MPTRSLVVWAAVPEAAVPRHARRVRVISLERLWQASLDGSNKMSLMTKRRRSRPGHGMVAGEEKGLVASMTNMTRAVRSLVPLLETCMGMPGPCPGMN